MIDYYTVKARIKKSWFSKPEIVFDVREHFQYWDDPSFGHGGGDYKDAVRVVGTYSIEQDAVSVCDTLNKHNGKKVENNC